MVLIAMAMRSYRKRNAHRVQSCLNLNWWVRSCLWKAKFGDSLLKEGQHLFDCFLLSWMNKPRRNVRKWNRLQFLIQRHFSDTKRLFYQEYKTRTIRLSLPSLRSLVTSSTCFKGIAMTLLLISSLNIIIIMLL